MEEPVH